MYNGDGLWPASDRYLALFTQNMSANQELLNQGRYRIVHPLPSAPESTVFNAYDTVGNVNVVVKEIHMHESLDPNGTLSENALGHFTGQAEHLKGLRHDHIVRVEDYFSETGRQFLVLESLPGKTLRDSLEDSPGPVPLFRASEWMDQIFSALDFLSAQTKGFAHGKICPENIYVSNFGQLKVGAVGVGHGSSFAVDTAIEPPIQSTNQLAFAPLEMIWDSLDPASQKVIGNSYDEMAEAILLQPPDARTDVFSLGALLYRLLTGQEPLDALERSIEMLEGKPDPLQEPSRFNKELSKELADVILKALEIRRENRYATVADMAAALRSAMPDAKKTEAVKQRQPVLALDAGSANDLKESEVARIIEAKKREFETEKRRQAELLNEKLRQAEEQRKIAEENAAKAELVLRKQQAAKVQPPAAPEDDLLGLATPDSVINDPAEPVIVAKVVSEPDDDPIDLSVSAVVSKVPAQSTTFVYESDIFSEPKRGFPMGLIAGAAALLLIVVIGAIYFVTQLGSAPPVQSAVPQTESQPQEISVDPVDPQQPLVPENAFLESNTNVTAAETPVRTAATPTPEKKKTPLPEPTKAKPEPAKKVTVDDLINDN